MIPTPAGREDPFKGLEEAKKEEQDKGKDKKKKKSEDDKPDTEVKRDDFGKKDDDDDQGDDHRPGDGSSAVGKKSSSGQTSSATQSQGDTSGDKTTGTKHKPAGQPDFVIDVKKRRVSASDLLPQRPVLSAKQRARSVPEPAGKKPRAVPNRFRRETIQYQLPDEPRCKTCQEMAMFHCTKCNDQVCLSHLSDQCTCGPNFVNYALPPAVLPPSISRSLDKNISSCPQEWSVLGDDPDWNYDMGEAGRVRAGYLEDLTDKVVNQKRSTGNVALDEAIREYNEDKRDIDISEISDKPWHQQDLEQRLDACRKKFGIYKHDDFVPTVEFHRSKQVKESRMIQRPECFLLKKDQVDHYYTEEQMLRYVELYSSCLGGNREPKTDDDIAMIQRSSDKLDLMVLNLGNVDHDTRLTIGGRKKVSDYYATDHRFWVLPHLVLNHGAHISVLMEADGFRDQDNVCQRYGYVGMVVRAVRSTGNAIACFVKGSKAYGTGIELIRHMEATYDGKNNWLLHACTFRVIFGVNSGRTFDRATGVIKEFDTTDANADQAIRHNPRAIDSTWEDDQLCHFCAYAEEMPKGNIGYEAGNDNDIKRLGQAEVRIVGFHAESHSFDNCGGNGLNASTKMLYYAIADQVDFICGDGNKYATRVRQKSDVGSDHNHSCIIARLERRKNLQIHQQEENCRVQNYIQDSIFNSAQRMAKRTFLQGSSVRLHDLHCAMLWQDWSNHDSTLRRRMERQEILQWTTRYSRIQVTSSREIQVPLAN